MKQNIGLNTIKYSNQSFARTETIDLQHSDKPLAADRLLLLKIILIVKG